MYYDNLKLSNILEGGLGSGRAYWLASVGVIADNDGACFGSAYVDEILGLVSAGASNLFISGGGERDDSFAVRPVVYLKSGVTNEQCAKIADKIEPEWSNGGTQGGASEKPIPTPGSGGEY